MKAVLVRDYGDVNQLVYGDTPDLKPGAGEVLVKWRRPASTQSTGNSVAAI